jgi:hypothetical protein
MEAVLLVVATILVTLLGVPLIVIFSIKYIGERKVRKYWHSIAVSLDQTGASFLGWDMDITISERLGLTLWNNKANWFEKLLCKFLNLFDDGHCLKQALKYYEEVARGRRNPLQTI